MIYVGRLARLQNARASGIALHGAAPRPSRGAAKNARGAANLLVEDGAPDHLDAVLTATVQDLHASGASVTWREIALETVMLPTVDQSLPNLNHRTLVVLLLMIGGVGCVVELTGASIILPRLVLFASVLAFGVVYAVRRARTLGLAPSLQGWHV